MLNLRCANGHGFEGWFGSEDDFLDQNGRGLIDCPVCADCTVVRLPSVPQPGAVSPATSPPAPQPVDLQAMWLQSVRQLMARTEDVGDRFAEEARRIHYGETAERGIRGQTSAEERQALSDEGIEVMSIPVPQALKGPLQ